MSELERWTAQWCWTKKHLSRPWNSYVYFRHAFRLNDEPSRAVVRVSADARYTLYVNGVRVHQGPARSFPDKQSFDTLDLRDLLHAGDNAICAIVHQFGVPTFFHIFRDVSGFILDGVIEAGGQTVPVHTPEGWLARPARGWRKDVARLSIQQGFQEHFDADADPADWMSPTFEAKEEDGWLPPKWKTPVGAHPYVTMEPRGVPLLSDHVENFTEILGQYRGENVRGYKVADDVYHLPLQEERKKASDLVDAPEAMLRDNDDVTTINPPTDGEFVQLVLDLGQYRTGHIMLDIAEAAGDEIIDVIYAEVLDKNRLPQIVGPGTNSEEATADRYRCRPGEQKWEAFQFKGMKVVSLIFRNVEKPLKIRRVCVRQVHAGFESVGRFECSDERLNEIWKVARWTQINCAFDAFVDCPWREQAMGWGDARVQSRVTAFAFGDTSLLERGIRLMARSQKPDGSLHAHPPADLPMHRLPDFMMTWVGSLWDYYFYTGSVELLRQCLPVMHRLFEFFRQHEVEAGLVGNFDGWWVFLDWQEIHKTNLSGVLNLMYLQSLRWAAAICQVVGDNTSASGYARRADALAGAINKYFWDEKAKCWNDGYDLAKKEQINEMSQHMNALAVLLNLHPESRHKIAKDILWKSATAKRPKVLTASPFFYAYVLQAMSEAGLRAEAVDIIREKWGAMIDEGATTFWETWGSSVHLSRCHAWSAGPLYLLTENVLGVMPVEPGWRRVRIAPMAANLEFAKGVVPSPLGRIIVEWEKVGDDQLAVRVELPQGMEADFVGPLGETRSLDSGMHEFNT
jgi:hypothetical protein